MQVRVRMPKSSPLTFDVDAAESVRALKSRIEVATGVPMNRIRLSLAGDEMEEGLVSIVVARAAAKDPRLKTGAVLALLRQAGHEAVNQLVLENATFNAMVEAEPEHLSRVREHLNSLPGRKSRSPSSSNLSTCASESDCSYSSLELDCRDNDIASFHATEAVEDEYSMDHLIRQNELRSNKLRFLMAERQNRVR